MRAILISLFALGFAIHFNTDDKNSNELILAEIDAEAGWGCNDCCGCHSHCGCHNHCDCDCDCDCDGHDDPEPDCYDTSECPEPNVCLLAGSQYELWVLHDTSS